LDVAVDLACGEAFEAADGVALRVSFRNAPLEVFDRWRVATAEAGHDDGPQRGVASAVTGAVEPAPLGVAGRDGHGGGAAQRREARLGGEPLGVVACGAQQRAGVS